MLTAAIEVVSPVVSTPVGDLRNSGFSKFPLIRQLDDKGYARRFRMAFVDQHEALVFFEPSQPFPVCRFPLRRSGAVKIERGSDWFPVAREPLQPMVLVFSLAFRVTGAQQSNETPGAVGFAVPNKSGARKRCARGALPLGRGTWSTIKLGDRMSIFVSPGLSV